MGRAEIACASHLICSWLWLWRICRIGVLEFDSLLKTQKTTKGSRQIAEQACDICGKWELEQNERNNEHRRYDRCPECARACGLEVLRLK